MYFDVDNSIGGGLVSEVVHGDKVFGEVLEFYAHVLRMCYWCHEVEVSEVNGAVARTLGRDDTVEVELDSDHVNSERTTVPMEVDSVTTLGEVRAIGVILFEAIVYEDAPICDVLELGEWDFIVCNEHNSIDAFADAGDTLGQTEEFSGVRFAPKFLVLWVDKRVPHL